MRRRIHRALRTAGTALVEFAIVAPFLLLLLAGVLDYGMALSTAAAVASAARAGAQYGASSVAHSGDPAGIRAAASNAAPDVKNLTVSSVQSCQCSGGGAVSCAGTCANGKIVVYVQVTARATSPAIFTYSGLGFTGATSTKASARAQ